MALSSLFLLLSLVPSSDEAQARREVVESFAPYLAEPSEPRAATVRLERISTAVPWPRGLVFVGDELVALARGRHRNAGGIDPSVPDRCGELLAVDPDCFEPVVPGEQAGLAVRRNARELAVPDPAVFRLYDPEEGPPIEASTIDRPYCTLAYDPSARNLFLCGYSGVDLPGRRFRKNATDSILRYDLRDGAWHVVEQHDPSGVPVNELGYVVPNQYYPHHDPAKNPPPHGWLNGPDGAEVVGNILYAVAKDNHAVVAYDLDAIRREPDAPAPPSRRVMGREVDVRLDGRLRRIEALGACALAARDGYLYVGYRTSSFVLRFPIEADGMLVEPIEGELIAAFTPWKAAAGHSANLIDLAFDPEGELFASTAERGRIWNIGVPDPARPFDGIDEGDHPTANRPYVDLPILTENPRARTGNMVFDPAGNLYFCSGNYENGTRLAGVVYRAVRVD